MQAFYEESHVAQDFLVPMALLEDALTRVHDLFEVYPLWLCPHKVIRTEHQGAIRWRGDVLPVNVENGEESHMYVDVGVYGVAGAVKRGHSWWAPDAVKQFERWMIDHHSYSALYAIVELDEAAFERMFDRTLYREMKRRWDPQTLLVDCFSKIRRANL